MSMDHAVTGLRQTTPLRGALSSIVDPFADLKTRQRNVGVVCADRCFDHTGRGASARCHL